jgi:hypothetical protein
MASVRFNTLKHPYFFANFHLPITEPDTCFSYMFCFGDTLSSLAYINLGDLP